MFLVTVSVSSSWSSLRATGLGMFGLWNGLARLPRRRRRGALAGAGAVARGGRASSSATPTGRRPTLHTFIYLIRLRPRSTDKNAPSTEPSLF
jgi:hypothetical protein